MDLKKRCAPKTMPPQACASFAEASYLTICVEPSATTVPLLKMANAPKQDIAVRRHQVFAFACFLPHQSMNHQS
jgi:hypothetical protein